MGSLMLFLSFKILLFLPLLLIFSSFLLLFSPPLYEAVDWSADWAAACYVLVYFDDFADLGYFSGTAWRLNGFDIALF